MAYRDDPAYIAELEDRIRRLETRTSGFTPIGAYVFDGFSVDFDPSNEEFDIAWTIDTLDDYDGVDLGEIGQTSNGNIPPNETNHWMRYVKYDDGFGANTGGFTVPETAVYTAQGYVGFSVINGVVEHCSLRIRGNGTMGWSDGPRQEAGGSDIELNVSGQALVEAGTTVRLELNIDLSGLTGLSGSTHVIHIPRDTQTTDPPTPSASGISAAHFAIVKDRDG